MTWPSLALVSGGRTGISGAVYSISVTPRRARVGITSSQNSAETYMAWMSLVLPVQCVDEFSIHRFILQLEAFLQRIDELSEGASCSCHLGDWLLGPFGP